MTRNWEQVHEKQYFTCVGTSGTFTLTFREQTTAPIQISATVASLKASIEALLSVGTVDVAFTSGTSVCAATQINVVSVTFKTELGGAPWVDQTQQKMVPSVPNMVPGSISSSLTIVKGYDGTITIGSGLTAKLYTNIQGTHENHVCSDRGICDFLTGICGCFTGYGSSDGSRGEGKRGDCGYVEPYLTFTG